MEQSKSNIVKTYRYGNAIAVIRDGYFKNQTPEERERIDKEIARVAWKIIVNARKRGIDI